MVSTNVKPVRPRRNWWLGLEGQWSWTVEINIQRKHPRREEWGDIVRGLCDTEGEAIKQMNAAAEEMKADWS